MAWFSRWKSADACRLLPTLDAVQTTRYRRFRRLLDHNRTALTLQADLEQVYYDNLPFTFQMVARKGSQLLVEVDGMVQALAGMTGADYQPMVAVLEGIEQSVEAEWTGPQRLTETTLVLPLDRVDRDELDLAGAKAANLGHVRNRLGLRTPDGFAVTTVACRRFLDETDLRERIDTLLADLEDDDPQRLAAVSEEILARVTAAAVPRISAGPWPRRPRPWAPGDWRCAVRPSARTATSLSPASTPRSSGWSRTNWPPPGSG